MKKEDSSSLKKSPYKKLKKSKKKEILTIDEQKAFEDALGPELVPRFLLNKIIYDEFGRKSGGQTNYDPKFCDQIIYLGSKGIGVAQAVLYMGITAVTAYELKQIYRPYPQFV